jgi:uncharacterized membrane protein YhaH (DUF805 family)
MTWMQKVFGFQGRLGRRDFWLIFLGVTIANWIATAVFPIPATPPALLSEEDPVHRAWAAGAVIEANWINGAIAILLFWPCLAASVKRCHDRNRSGLWLIAFWGPALVSGMTGVVVRQFWLTLVYGTPGPYYGWPVAPFLTASTVAFILWLWGLVELGLLPG